MTSGIDGVPDATSMGRAAAAHNTDHGTAPMRGSVAAESLCDRIEARTLYVLTQSIDHVLIT